MKKVVIAILLVLTLLSAPKVTNVKASSRTVSDMFYSTYTTFAIESFQDIITEENVLYSPMSLYQTLAMIMSISENDALSQFENLLGVDKETLLDQMPLLMNDIAVASERADYWFNNTIFYDNSNQMINPEIIQSYQSYFNFDFEEHLFYNGDAGDALAEKITEGTDHFLELSGADFDYIRASNILFNNSIYYKGEWTKKYKTTDAVEALFYPLTGDSYMLTYMHKSENVLGYDDVDATALIDTFVDGSKMILILPPADQTPVDLINNKSLMKKLMNPDSYYHRSASIYLPSFDVSSTLFLVEPLKAMGLIAPFEFSTDTFPDAFNDIFKLTDMRQISRIQVDETGATVATTTISIGCAASATAPLTFKANRPFVYIIMSATDIPLFIGVNYSFSE